MRSSNDIAVSNIYKTLPKSMKPEFKKLAFEDDLFRKSIGDKSKESSGSKRRGIEDTHTKGKSREPTDPKPAEVGHSSTAQEESMSKKDTLLKPLETMIKDFEEEMRRMGANPWDQAGREAMEQSQMKQAFVSNPHFRGNLTAMTRGSGHIIFAFKANALLDTGCDYNLISSSMVKRHEFRSSDYGKPFTIVGPDGRSLKTSGLLVHARWINKEESWQGPQAISGDFHVIDSDQFEVLIGKETIEKYGLYSNLKAPPQST
jgi:hypothetical protein